MQRNRPRREPPCWIHSTPEMTAITVPTTIGEPDIATETRWIGVGTSTTMESYQAGREAAGTAIRGTDARLLIVFASPAQDLAAMIQGVRSVAPAVPLIGCTTAGEIATDGPGDNGVVVTALGGTGFSVVALASRKTSSDLRGAG